MDEERLSQRVSEFFKAIKQLEKATQQPNNEFIRDSVIQRFEFTYELAWKMLKLILEKEGIVARSPKETFQEALQMGLIQDGNLWSKLQKERNLTTHTYDETLAKQVYFYICDEGLSLFQQLENKIQNWQKQK